MSIVVASTAQGLRLGKRDAGHTQKQIEHRERAQNRCGAERRRACEQRERHPHEPFAEVVGMTRVPPESNPARAASIEHVGLEAFELTVRYDLT